MTRQLDYVCFCLQQLHLIPYYSHVHLVCFQNQLADLCNFWLTQSLRMYKRICYAPIGFTCTLSHLLHVSIHPNCHAHSDLFID